MVNEFCGFRHCVIGTDKMPADTTLNNMKKADLIKLLHTAQHNYETLMWFYNNAVKVNMSQLNNNGWISVEDELPNVTRCRVTVQYDMDFGEVAYDTMDATFSRFGIFGSEYRFEDSWRNDITNNVIAWKHLDAPYKKGE